MRAEEGRGSKVVSALEGGPRPDDAAGKELVDLADRLRATRPLNTMDPLVRRSIRAALLALHPANSTVPEASLHYATIQTAIGFLSVAYTSSGVVASDLDVSGDMFERKCVERLGRQPEFVSVSPASLRTSVLHALESGRFRGKIDFSLMPAFQRRVLEETLKIRKGEVRSYAWIARAIGAPGASRAVGSALARNPIPILIPCHRVVRADYALGEYSCGGPFKKREILLQEGVNIALLERFRQQGFRFEGSATTHIFCLPDCYTGRRMKPHYRRFFASATEAQSAGFRACKVCKPA